MARQHLWTERETREVERRFQENPMYRVLRKVSLDLMENARTFALTSGELFYNVVYIMDMVRSEGDKERRLGYCEEAWSETYCYIADRVEADGSEMRYAASAIVVLAGCLLNEAMPLKYMDEVTQLFAATVPKEGPRSWEVRPMLIRVMMKEFRDHVKEYVKSDRYLSDEVEDIVLQLRNAGLSNVRGGNQVRYDVTNVIFNPRIFRQEVHYAKCASVIKNFIRLDGQESPEACQMDPSVQTEWYYILKGIREARVAQGDMGDTDFVRQMMAWYPECFSYRDEGEQNALVRRYARSLSNERSKWKSSAGEEMPIDDMYAHACACRMDTSWARRMQGIAEDLRDRLDELKKLLVN